MNNLSFISPYGFKPIAIALGLAFVSYIADFECLENIFIIVTLGLIYVYRNTSRHIFENDQSILSPIDGKVIAIDTVGDKTQIYVKVTPCANHNIRAPFNGEFKVANTRHGLNLDPMSPKAQFLNEKADIDFIADNNGKTTMGLKLISGFCNPKIELDEGIEQVTQGKKIGFFIDGLAILTLDKDIKSLVNIGDKLKAGQSLITKID